MELTHAGTKDAVREAELPVHRGLGVGGKAPSGIVCSYFVRWRKSHLNFLSISQRNANSFCHKKEKTNRKIARATNAPAVAAREARINQMLL